MPFFYKHIEEIPKQINPTGLKRGPTREKYTEKRYFCEIVFYKKLFSTRRCLNKNLPCAWSLPRGYRELLQMNFLTNNH